MNRKDKTMKQLQAECKKRKIGFMTSWTKMALIKRLEDEDNRDKEYEKLKSTSEKNKKIAASVKKELKKVSPAQIKDDLKEQLIKKAKAKEQRKKQEFNRLQERYQILKTEMNEIGMKKAELMEEIDALKLSMKIL